MVQEARQAISEALEALACRTSVLGQPATAEAILTAEKRLAFRFPADYSLFLKTADGAEFDVASLWSTSGLPILNEKYGFPKFAPWFVAIGSNGGGEAIGYFRSKPELGVFAVHFVDMDVPIPVAGNVTEVLRKLASGQSLVG